MNLARDVSKLLKQGNKVIIVSSGAVGYGKDLIKECVTSDNETYLYMIRF